MEIVAGDSEIITETFGETRPREFMILVGDEDEHMTPFVARIVDHGLLGNSNRFWLPTRKHAW